MIPSLNEKVSFHIWHEHLPDIICDCGNNVFEGEAKHLHIDNDKSYCVINVVKCLKCNKILCFSPTFECGTER